MKKEKWEIIAYEYVVSLFPVFIMAKAFSLGFKEKYKVISVDFAEKIKNNSVVYYCKADNFYRGHIYFVNKLKENSNYLRRVFNQIMVLGKEQIKLAEKLSAGNLKSLSNSQIYSRYQKYCDSNYNYYCYGLVLPMLDFQKTTFLSDEISLFLKQKNALNYFSILTTPLQNSYDKIQELNLLKITAQIKKNKQVVELLKNQNSQEVYRHLLKKNKSIAKAIKSHTKKFAWIHYVYEGPAADEAYFIDIIKDFLRRRIDPIQEIANNAKEKKLLKIKQLSILKALKVDKYHRAIILLGRDSVYFKITRRNLQTASYYYIEPVLREIGRRLQLSLKQVRMLNDLEIKNALLKNQLNLKVINQRLQLLVNVWQNQKNQLLIGNQAINFLKKTEKEKVYKNVKEIKGTTAYPGKAKGIVKIINTPDEIKKMKPGDILVSGATNPNLMPAIRQAAGIVTDEGGLTCHAAIVSRELKIPCVVGTGFVTQALKDGDRVEVNATLGIVRKI